MKKKIFHQIFGILIITSCTFASALQENSKNVETNITLPTISEDTETDIETEAPTPTSTSMPTNTPSPTPVPDPITLDNVSNIEILDTIVAHPSGQLVCMDISGDGKRVITGGTDFSTRIIDLEFGTIERVYYMGTIGTLGVKYSNDDQYYLSAHGHGDIWQIRNIDKKEAIDAIFRIDPITEESGKKYLNTFLSVDNMIFYPDMTIEYSDINPEGNSDFVRPESALNLVGIRIDENDVELWLETTKMSNFPEKWKTPLQAPFWVWHISYDNELPDEFEASRMTAGGSGTIEMIDYSPSGNQFAFGTSGITGNAVIVPTNGEKSSITIPANVEGQYKKTISVKFSPDGTLLATGGDYPIVRIWDPVSGELLESLSGHASWIFDLAFSPDGKKLASMGYDSLIYIWDTQTWEYTQLMRHQDVLTGVFSQNGDILFAGGRGPTLVVWNAETGEKIQTMELTGTILSIKVFASGDRIAVGTLDGKITIIGIK